MIEVNRAGIYIHTDGKTVCFKGYISNDIAPVCLELSQAECEEEGIDLQTIDIFDLQDHPESYF